MIGPSPTSHENADYFLSMERYPVEENLLFVFYQHPILFNIIRPLPES